MFSLNNYRVNDFIQSNTLCREFLDQINRDYIQSISQDNIKVGLIIDHDLLNKPIKFFMRFKNEFNTKMLWESIAQVIHSRKPEDMIPTHKFTITLHAAVLNKGAAKKINEIFFKNRKLIFKVCKKATASNEA